MKPCQSFQCPVEATLQLIGGKYKSLILWHLIGKTLRFLMSIWSFSYADIVAFLVHRISASCSCDIPAAFLISLILVPIVFPASVFLIFSPFPKPKRKYNMSYDGTEKEPAKRIKIKRFLVIFPFCRLLIVFCYIQLVYKLLRSGIIFKDSRHYRNHGPGSSVQSDGPPTGSFYSVIYYSCSIFMLLILFKSDFFSDPG